MDDYKLKNSKSGRLFLGLAILLMVLLFVGTVLICIYEPSVDVATAALIFLVAEVLFATYAFSTVVVIMRMEIDLNRKEKGKK